MRSPPPTTKAILARLSTPERRLIVLDLICGIVLMVPFFRPEMETPGLGLLAIILLLPYLMVCWRLLRSPGTKDGPGLAAGIGVVFTLLAALGVAVAVEGRHSAQIAYFVGMGVAHALLVGLGFAAFRQGASTKPTWRVALRSIIDPFAYYGVVFFIALAMLSHHMLR